FILHTLSPIERSSVLNEMSATEISLRPPEAGESGAGNSSPAISGFATQLDWLTTFCPPIKVIALTYLHILFISCGLAFPLAVEHFSYLYTAPFVVVVCCLPVPFLIVGFNVMLKEYHVFSPVLTRYAVFLTVVTVCAWSMILVHSAKNYLA
ncbi:hypothetical protein PMAYCL1PPCAC_03768, partial [Pristionchus mayeri]